MHKSRRNHLSYSSSSRWSTWSLPNRLGVTVAAFVVYAVAFFPLYRVLGIGAAIAATLPVIVAGWSLGFRAGLLSGLLCLPLNGALFILTGEPVGAVFSGTSLAGTVGLILIGGVVGRLRDLRQDLKVELEERTQIESELRRLKDYSQSIVDAVSEGITVEDSTDRLTFVNPAAAKLLGYAPDELVGQHLSLVIPPDQMPIVRAANERRVRGESDRYELQLQRKDGSLIDVLMSGTPRFKGTKYAGTLGVFTDITGRKQAEIETKRRNRELAALNAVARVVSETLDLNQILKQALDTTLELTALGGGSIWLLDERTGELSVAVHHGLSMELLERAEDKVKMVFEHGAPSSEHLAGGKDEHPLMGDLPLESGGPAWGAAVPLIARGHAVGMLMVGDLEASEPTTEDYSLLVGIGNLIGAAVENAKLFGQVRLGRDRVQAVSRRLVMVQETERRQIARELHDEIGQSLTGLMLTLDMNQHLPPEATRNNLLKAEELVSDLIARVRRLSLDLRPAMLDDLGLLAALLWHFERYQAQTQIQVAFEHSRLERRFDEGIETASYRIVQEALTNAARHAGVREVTLRAWSDERKLNILIEDQGVGFDPEATLAAGTSSGLVGMSERASLLGGRLTVESAPGAGTRLTAELPFSGRIERRNVVR